MPELDSNAWITTIEMPAQTFSELLTSSGSKQTIYSSMIMLKATRGKEININGKNQIVTTPCWLRILNTKNLKRST